MSPGMGGYSTVGGAVSKMWREEGLRGFYKGLYPNLLKVRIPNNPIPSSQRTIVAVVPVVVFVISCMSLVADKGLL